MTVGARIVGGPGRASVAPIPSHTPSPAVPAMHTDRRWIHEARERPLGLFLVIGRDGKVVVLDARIFTPGLRLVLLESVGDGKQSDQQTNSPAHNGTFGTRIPSAIEP